MATLIRPFSFPMMVPVITYTQKVNNTIRAVNGTLTEIIAKGKITVKKLKCHNTDERLIEYLGRDGTLDAALGLDRAVQINRLKVHNRII